MSVTESDKYDLISVLDSRKIKYKNADLSLTETPLLGSRTLSIWTNGDKNLVSSDFVKFHIQ